jgi:carboxymethylenebutenolidase
MGSYNVSVPGHARARQPSLILCLVRLSSHVPSSAKAAKDPREKNLIKEQIMSESENPGAGSGLTAVQEYLRQLWEEHVRHEFTTHNSEETLATMVEDAYVNHIPVLTGGVGKDQLREFYSKRFIPQMPPDTEMIPVSRTIGNNQLVDEMVFKFTHTIRMDWMLPGVAPTGRRVEVPLVAIVHFREGKLAHEHIYWDQASVLVQLGLLEATTLPVAGIESARKVLDPSLPSNALMGSADQRQ